jgi:hypothetical protein
MATPDESQGRDYEVYVRGPVPNMQFAYTSTDTEKAYRGGIWHKPLLTAFPAPTDNELSDFGIQAGGGCTIEISDEMGDLDWPIEDQSADPILDQSGNPIFDNY